LYHQSQLYFYITKSKLKIKRVLNKKKAKELSVHSLSLFFAIFRPVLYKSKKYENKSWGAQKKMLHDVGWGGWFLSNFFLKLQEKRGSFFKIFAFFFDF